jgi:leishmanolysin-like peptidase
MSNLNKENIFTFFLACWYMFLYSPQVTLGHKCIHNHVKDEINNSPELSTKPDLYSKLNWVKGTNRRNLNSVPWSPLRIKVIFKLDDSPLDTNKQNFLKNKLLPDAILYWKRALSVRRPEKVLVEGNCTHVFEPPNSHVCGAVSTENYCGDIKIDSSLVARHAYYDQPGQTAKYIPATDGSGVIDADFILYVTASSTVHCGTNFGGDETLAYASMCRSDTHDRPVMGYANFCPNQVDDSDNKYWQQYKTAKHEIAHAIGFSSDSWAKMRKSDGTPRTTNHNLESYICANGASVSEQNIDAPSTNTIASTTKRGKRVHLVVTERVKEVARVYYGCNSIAGAELEDQIGAGCIGSHWEERTMFDELMTPLADNHYAGNRVSKFTLALFEDTGWYKANYSTADALQFGKNAGCDFLNEKCINPSTAKPLAAPKNTFCSPLENDANGYQKSCTFDLRGIGNCESGTYSANIPSIYQYFPSSPKLGGTIQHVDFCPLFTTFSNTDCQDETQNTAQSKNYRGFLYGMNSFCANSSLFDKMYVSPDKFEPNCFKMKCFSNPKSIQVTIRRKSASLGCVQGVGCGSDEDISFNCISNGQRITISDKYSGEFLCPSYDDICSQDAIDINLPKLPDRGNNGGTSDGQVNSIATNTTGNNLDSGALSRNRFGFSIGFILISILIFIFV